MPASRPPTDARVLRDVALGGATGAALRAGCLTTVALLGGRDLMGVVVVNLLGVVLLARLVTRAQHDPRWAAHAPLLATGLLGAFTTFSGLVMPLAVVARESRVAAVAWGLGSLVAGVVLAAAGLDRGRR